MIGLDRRTARAGLLVPAGRKALVAVLSISLIWGGVPAPAWALAAAGAQGDATLEAVEAPAAPAEDAEADSGAAAPEAAAPAEGQPEAAAPEREDAPASSSAAAAGTPGGAGQGSPAATTTPEGKPAPAARAARAGLDADYIYIHDAAGVTPSKVGVGQILRVDATYEDPDWGDEYDFADSHYEGMTFQWYAGTQKVTYASGDSAWKAKGYEPIEGAVERTFTVPAKLAGKRLAVRVVNPGGGVVWVSSSTETVTDGKTDLTRVEVSGKAKVGSTLRATAFEEGGWSGEQEVTAGVTYRWLSAPSADGAFAPIDGATGSTLVLDAALAGSYVKAEATSRNVVTSDPTGPVAAAGSAENEAKLAQAIAALEKDGFSGYYPKPVYGDDANLNEMIEGRLAELGFGNIESAVVSAGMEHTDPAAQGSIDTSSGASNGDIEFFFLAPAHKTVSTDFSLLRRFKPTYRLTYGDATDTFTPGRFSQLDWDGARVESFLDDAFATLELPQEIAGGVVPEDTKQLKLPSKVVDPKTGKTLAAITWSSSSPKVAKVTSGMDPADYSTVYTVTFTHGATPARATLTATCTMAGASGLPDTAVASEHPLEVAPRSGATTEQIERELTAILSKATVVDSATGEAVDPQAVAADLRFSRPRELGIDGAVYKLAYVSDSDAISIKGYRGVVTGNLEGETARSATLSAQLTYEGVTVTRELGTFTPAVVTRAQIDEAVAFMEQVKAGYGAALLGTNPAADAVMSDLKTFQSASRADDGSIAWARTWAERDDAGIVPVDLPGYDPMGSQPWRTFRSSREFVVASESLRVTQPTYNTKVRIDSCLTYKAYESLAAAHPDNAQLQKLVNQPVNAVFTVRGATGAENPDAGRTLTVNARVTGLGEPGADGMRLAEDWVPLAEVEVPADEDATAWDVFSQLLDRAGYTYRVNNLGPTSITTPDGRTLDSSFVEPYRYWAFFVDGAYGQGDEGSAMTCRVTDGMTIELRYLDDGAQTGPAGGVEVNPDAEHPHLDSEWNGYLNGGAGTVVQAPTASEAGQLAWAESLLTPEETAADAKLSASDPLIIDGRIYIVSAASSFDPITFAPTRTLARLQVIDRATGAVERQVTLGTYMDTTCRPVYADGVIVIPLTGGYLQAVSAKTLETLWVVPASTKGQALCTLTVHDGYVYTSTFDELDNDVAASGAVRRYNLHTGALAGDMRNGDSGYYWAGGVMVGEHFVIGDDAGVVHVFTADLSREVSSAAIGKLPIRTSLVAAEGFVYAVTRDDGTLHKLAVDEAGTVREVGSAKFADYSTSTPAIVGGRAFAGGVAGKWPNRVGVLAMIDLDTLEVTQVTKADGAPIRDEVKSAPLVSVQEGETYVYFTSNGVEGPWGNFTAGGGVYVYRVGDAEASVLFQPGEGMVEYCFASVICDADGNLYYTNDSGHLFKIAGKVVDGGGDGGETGGGDQGGDGQTGGGDGQTGGSDNQGGQGSDGGQGQTGNGGQPGGAQGNSGSISQQGGTHKPQQGGQQAVKPAQKPQASGSVPAGAKPLMGSADNSEKDAVQASEDDAQSGKDDRVDEAGSAALEPDGGDKALAPGARIALIAGAVGVVGLVASLMWMAASRRRKED